MPESLLHREGFTLIELVVVVGVLVVVLVSGLVAFDSAVRGNALKHYGYQLVQDLREARLNAFVRRKDDSWGVYFDDVSLLHGYTVFKGSAYVSRDPFYDRIITFPKPISFSQLNFPSSNEVVFSLSEGEAADPGNLWLSAGNDGYFIQVNALGLSDYNFYRWD